MSNEDFVELLDLCNIPMVMILSYGQKCRINCGNKLMHQMRTIDQQVAISFDIGVDIPPNMMHWARGTNCIPLHRNGDELSGFITLVKLTDHSQIDEEWGEDTVIEHMPIFGLPQVEISKFSNFPECCLNIFPGSGPHHSHSCKKIKVYNTSHHQMKEIEDSSPNDS